MTLDLSTREILNGELSGIFLSYHHETAYLLEICSAKAHNFDNEDIYEVCWWYKNLARFFLAEIDGIGWFMRQAVVTNAVQAGYVIDAKEMSKVSEVNHDLPFLDGIKKGLKHFIGLTGLAIGPVTERLNYQAFVELKKIRDAVTHPKQLVHTSPIHIFSVVKPSFTWYLLALREILAGLSGTATSITRSKESLDFKEVKRRKEQARVLLEGGLKSPPSQRAKRFLKLLEQDLERSIQFKCSTSDAPKQLTQRCLVYSTFSCLEGASLMMEDALSQLGKSPLASKKFLRGSDQDVRYALEIIFSSYSMSLGAETIDTNSSAWNLFRDCRALRNRLTHPKRASDLDFSPQEIGQSLLFARWVKRLLVSARPRREESSWALLSSSEFLNGGF